MSGDRRPNSPAAGVGNERAVRWSVRSGLTSRGAATPTMRVGVEEGDQLAERPGSTRVSGLSTSTWRPCAWVMPTLLARENPALVPIATVVTWGAAVARASRVPSVEPLSTTVTSTTRSPRVRSMLSTQARTSSRQW